MTPKAERGSPDSSSLGGKNRAGAAFPAHWQTDDAPRTPCDVPFPLLVRKLRQLKLLEDAR